MIHGPVFQRERDVSVILGVPKCLASVARISSLSPSKDSCE